MLNDLHHIGIVVDDLDAAENFYDNVLGLKKTHREVIADQAIEAVLLNANNCEIELLKPIDDISGVAKYLEKSIKIFKEEQDAWIQDQYEHPKESLHTIDEVMDWFKKNNVEFISSIPSCDFNEDDKYDDIFEKKKTGNYLKRFLNQIFMIFSSLGSDGGLFIIVGKKKDV